MAEVSTVGNEIIAQHTVLDGASNPLTGMLSPADITFSMLRQSGSTMIAAVEAITWTEIGVTGEYYLTFTPLSVGLYSLHLREIDPSTQLRRVRWDFNVLTAGAVFVPNLANAYCSEVQTWRDWKVTSRHVWTT